MPRGMMSALEEEARRQPESLARFSRSNLPRAPEGSIFVGAGDSYAAALAGFYASSGRCIALDPYSLAASPGIAKGLEVFFISVSGRTVSNTAAAEAVAGVARRRTALTADRGSRLAKLADRTVTLPMTYVPRSPGILSFSLSLLAVMKIAGGWERCDFARAFDAAKRNSERKSVAKRTTYFLGNSLAYPAALYAAAKTYELLGATAHAELLEEFSHMELFSVRRSDAVNMFACFDPAEASARLGRALGEEGYRARVIPASGTTDPERLFHAVFVAQLALLGEARKEGVKEPSFLKAEGRLGVSDAMIY